MPDQSSNHLTIYWFLNDQEQVRQSYCQLMEDCFRYQNIAQHYNQFIIKYDIRYETQIYYKTHFSTLVLFNESSSIDTSYLKDRKIQLYIMKLSKKLQKRIQKLQNCLIQLEKRQMQLEASQKNLIDKLKLPQKLQLNQKDQSAQISMIYSQPLYNPIDNPKGGADPRYKPVDFRKELYYIQKTLRIQNCKRNIKIQCDIGRPGTIRNSIIKYHPKILHISCHGNKAGQLAIEDSQIGLAVNVKPESVMEQFIQAKQYKLPEIVVINSCYSGKVGQSLRQIPGIKAIITIKSNSKISELAAQKFSEKFYERIFQNFTVKQSVDYAKSSIVNSLGKYNICCCETSEHKHSEKCLWKQVLKQKNPLSHNNFHVPPLDDKICRCPKKNQNIHAQKCQWARKTLMHINMDYRIQINEKQYRFPKQSEYPSYHKKGQLKICCCPQLNPNHTVQQQKFQLYLDNNVDFRLYKTIESGQTHVYGESMKKILEYSPEEKLLYGRQKDLYDFLKLIVNQSRKSISVVYGEQGVGKTSFIKKAALYAHDRRIFDRYFYIPISNVKSFNAFVTKFRSEITLHHQKQDEYLLKNMKKSFKSIIIIDDCDSLIRKQVKQFFGYLQTILNKISDIVIVLVIKQDLYEMEQLSKNSVHLGKYKDFLKSFKLKKLPIQAAAGYLYKKFKNITRCDMTVQKCQKLLRQYEFLRNPQKIEAIDIIKNEQYVDKPIITYQQIKDKLKQITDQNKRLINRQSFVAKRLIGISNEMPKQFELLVFLSLFTIEISKQQLQRVFKLIEIVKNNEKKFKIAPQTNWQQRIDNIQNIKKRGEQIQRVTRVVNKQYLNDYDVGKYSSDQDEQELRRKMGNLQLISKYSDNQKKQYKKQNNYYFYQNDHTILINKTVHRVLWADKQNVKVLKAKIFYTIYFSIGLQLIIKQLKSQYILHQELLHFSAVSNGGIFKQRFCQHKSQFDYFMTFQNILKSDKKSNKLFQKGAFLFIKGHLTDMQKIYQANLNSQDVRKVAIFLGYQTEQNQFIRYFFEIYINLMILIPTSLLTLTKQNPNHALNLINQSTTALKLMQQQEKQTFSNLQNYKQLKQNIFLAYLKLQMMKINIILDNTTKEKLQIIRDRIDQRFFKIQYLFDSSKIKQQTFVKSLRKQFIWEKRSIYLYYFYKYFNSPGKITYEKKTFFQTSFKICQQKWKQGFTNPKFEQQAIMMGKQYILLCMNYQNLPSEYYQQGQYINVIRQLCRLSWYIFQNKGCYKLLLLALRTQLRIFKKIYDKNINLEDLNKNKAVMIQQFLSKVRQAQNLYASPKYKLYSLDQFKFLIQQCERIRQRYWQNLNNSILLFRAFPILNVDNQPQLKNLIRSNRLFSQQMKKALNNRIDNSDEYPDITIKFAILNKDQLQTKLSMSCTVMVLYGDFQKINGKVSFLIEGLNMKEQIIYLQRFMLILKKKMKAKILIIVGQNSGLAYEPIKITLQDSNIDRLPSIFLIDLIKTIPQYEQALAIKDHQILRKFISQRKQLRSGGTKYIMNFLRRITTQNIDIDLIHKIHEQSMKVAKKQSSNIKFYELLNKSMQKIPLRYGKYLDLSPQYLAQTNVSVYSRNKFNPIILRDQERIIEVLSKFSTNQSHKFINIYSKTKNKTTFIQEIIGIMIQREIFSNGGIYMFEGKQIHGIQQTNKFQEYINNFNYINSLNLNNKLRFPPYQKFLQSANSNMLVIFDDFDMIPSQYHTFIHKLIDKFANIIFITRQPMSKDSWNIQIQKIQLQQPEEAMLDFYMYHILKDQNFTKSWQYYTKKKQSGKLKTLEQINNFVKDLNVQIQQMKY